MQKTSKRKILLVGMGLFWGSGILALAIAAPFILESRKNEHLVEKVSQKAQVKTSVININEKQLQIRVTNLDQYLNQWLVIEYQAQNGTNVLEGANRGTKRSFFVSSKIEIVAIGGLIPGVKYNYSIKTQSDNMTISTINVFSTYSKPHLNIDSKENSISFTSSELNREYLNNSIIVRYKIFENRTSAIQNYDNSQEISVAVELREIAGQQVYAISGTILNLEKSTPYIISLHIRGQEGAIADPVIVWTKGNNAGLIAANPTATSAQIQVSGLNDYVVNPNPNVTFALSYATTAEPTTEIRRVAFTLGNDVVIINNLSGLVPNTQYNVNLLKIENNVDEILGETANFWTLPQPSVKTLENTGITTNWRKSATNAFLTITGLKSNQSASNNINFSDLQAVLVEVADDNATPNFASSPVIVANLASENPASSDQYLVALTGLAASKQYAIQIFKKTDTTFEQTLLNETLLVKTPDLLTAVVTELTALSAKITVGNLNNYQSGELKLSYWKKGDSSSKIDVPITFEVAATEFIATVSNLESIQEYEFVVTPIYSDLSAIDNNLLATTEIFETLGILTAAQVEGNTLADSVKFKVGGMSSDFPINQPLAVQWRVKAADTTDIPVEWAALSDQNSFDFNVATIASNREHTIEISNHNHEATWYSGVTYEWRIVQKSEPTINLIKAGNVEFNFTDSAELTSTFNLKIPAFAANGVKWQAPQYENIVASKFGNAAGKTMWRDFFGLKTKVQWRHYLEWLAFQEEDVKTKAITQIVNAFKIYMPPAGNTITHSSQIDLQGRYTAVPYLPSNHGGSTENGESHDDAVNDLNAVTDAKFGGVLANAYSSATPIKPSEFMSMSGENSTFINNWDNFKKSVEFFLNGFKLGWNGSESAFGISRDNIFGDGQTLSLAETYASYIDNKARLDGLLLVQPTVDKNLVGWTIETLDNSSNVTNIWANDLTGELNFKVKATKDGKVHYHWTKMLGFKTVDPSAVPTSSDLVFSLAPTHARSASAIQAELMAISDNQAKKAIIEKYYNVKMAPFFKSGWTFESSSLSNGEMELILKVKLPIKNIVKGNPAMPLETSQITSTTEFTYNLASFNLATITAPELSMTGQSGTLTAAESGSSATRFTNISWTYEQMLGKMKDAVAKGTTNVETLATEIINGMTINTDWVEVDHKFYFRSFGNNPIANWGDHTKSAADYEIKDENKNGFVTQSILATNDDATRKEKIIEMINFYGAA